MTDEELKAYINMTINGATRQLADAVIKKLADAVIKKLEDDGLIKKQSDIQYAKAADRLYEYYKSQETGIDEIMLEALTQISDDTYFQIIPLYYEEHLKIENVAVYFGVDVSTIVRNKKRLCLKVYDMIKE